MRPVNLSTKLFIAVMSLFLTILFILPVSAVKEWRESNLERGWQIWISAIDFDKSEIVRTGDQEKKLAGASEEPWLAKDILIAKVAQGFADYTFESPVAGKAYIWGRVADFRGGGQSWYIVLNSDLIADAGDSLIIDTQGPVWIWRGGRDIPESKSPTDLKKAPTPSAFNREKLLRGLRLCLMSL